MGTLPFENSPWMLLDLSSAEASAELGRGALAHIQHYVREAVQQAQVGTLFGRRTAVLNVPYLNCSDVGNRLAETHEVSLTWFERGDGVVQFSLRSIGDIDVSEIATRFGGGGHRNAAGFQMDFVESRVLINEILHGEYGYSETSNRN